MSESFLSDPLCGAYVNRYDLPYDETPYRFDIEASDFLALAGKLGCTQAP